MIMVFYLLFLLPKNIGLISPGTGQMLQSLEGIECPGADWEPSFHPCKQVHM